MKKKGMCKNCKTELANSPTGLCFACRDPNPEDIAAACERIQTTWKAHDRERRIVQHAQPVEVTKFNGGSQTHYGGIKIS